MKNRITELLGVEHPIVQAPMGWIARAQLASAVSNAGGICDGAIMAEFAHAKDLYFGGDMEASIALSGQVCGRITSVEPVADIIRDTVAGFETVMRELAARYAGAAG